jgi:kinesin family protein 3/17
MQGIPEDPILRGIIPNAFHHVFSHIARTPERQFLVRVSFLEIYNEEVRDLLAPSASSKGPQQSNCPQFGTSLELKENPDSGVYVKDLQAFPVNSVEEMESYMALGNKSRSVAATQMNAQSSRSHSIFTITIESILPTIGGGDSEGEGHIVAGKLHLVDLAGSERQSKTGAQGDRLKEAAKINLSLSALGNCIAALVDGKRGHVPYRDSKLTRLLQDSLGGNSKTLMLATLSPASYNYDETLSTLRYANRAKNIQNKPKVNEDPKDALLKEYQQEIQRLQELLLQRKGKPSSVYSSLSSQHKKRSAKALQGTNESVAVSPSGNSLGTPILEIPEEDVAGTLASMDPSTLHQLQLEIESEKSRLLASKDMAVEQKQKLVHVLESRLTQLVEEREARTQLASQLAALESKLLVGGRNIYEHVSAQERALEDARLAKLEEERKQRDLQVKLEHMLEGNMALEESYASLQEEVDVKTRKLHKMWCKLEDVKKEIADLDSEWRAERMELTAAVRELFREVELKDNILEMFVPFDERRNAEQRLVFESDVDDWIWVPSHLMLSNHQNTQSEEKDEVPQHEFDENLHIIGENGTSKHIHKNKMHLVERLPISRPVASMCKRPMCFAAKQILQASSEEVTRSIAASATLKPIGAVRYCFDNILSIPLFSPENSSPSETLCKSISERDLIRKSIV